MTISQQPVLREDVSDTLLEGLAVEGLPQYHGVGHGLYALG